MLSSTLKGGSGTGLDGAYAANPYNNNQNSNLPNAQPVNINLAQEILRRAMNGEVS